MGESFHVHRIAMHLVDRHLPEPRFSRAEVDLASFDEEEREALNRFFDGHLGRAWTAPEGERTRAARLAPESDIRRHFEELRADDSSFLERSRQMGRRLHDVTRGLTATPGLLMILWFRRAGDERRFLGLLKMDPGPSDVIRLEEDESGQLLLDLVVERVEHALPKPEAGVLKWAILPHPTRPTFDLKLKDQEGPADVAKYFTSFLDCLPRASERRQARTLLEVLTGYVEEFHRPEDPFAIISDMVDDLEHRTVVTWQAVESALEHSGLAGVQPAVVRDRLEEKGAVDLDLSPRILRTFKLRYELSIGIWIQGPQDLMEQAVEIVPLGDQYEFRVQSATFQKHYVG